LDLSFFLLGQLPGADYDYQTDESYTYDDNGNRTGATAGSSSSVYVTGDDNQLLSDGTYTYTDDAEVDRHVAGSGPSAVTVPVSDSRIGLSPSR
jgi:hypothetical protein